MSVNYGVRGRCGGGVFFFDELALQQEMKDSSSS